MHVINTSSLAALHLLVSTLLLSISHRSWHFPYFLTTSQIYSTGFLSSTCVSANLCPSLFSETEMISEPLLQWHLAVPSAESAPEPTCGQGRMLCTCPLCIQDLPSSFLPVHACSLRYSSSSLPVQ